MLRKLQASNGWKFFAVLARVDRRLAGAWWSLAVLRGLLPAVFAIAVAPISGSACAGTAPDAKKEPKLSFRLGKNLAATYSRRSYTTTTIGKTAFDGRVRNGNGSGHSFMATKKSLQRTRFSENCTQAKPRGLHSRVEIAFAAPPERRGWKSDQAARPISISPLNGLLRLHA